MTKELIELRNFLDQQELGESVPYSHLKACAWLSDEARACFKTEKEKQKNAEWFQSLLETNVHEARFIRLLFIDFIIISKVSF